MDFQLCLESESASSAYPETPVAVGVDTTVADVVRLMQAERTGAVIVCDQDDLVGVFTERDVLRLMSAGSDFSAPISEHMHQPVTSVPRSATVGEAIRRMSEGGYRHLPLVEDGAENRPVGMIDVRGIIHYLVTHFPNAIYNLPPNPQQAPAEREGA